ncbi:leucine-rich repeat domain-containing protein [Clostridium guangxiense]|uniref:leucine-rich repeat domain-containing protein n=1 Tax=Clostridium guangxiense TaxID=1662055 RepID=UPI001E4CE165|nr:leucine-rich repeat domain-containing protein [Clostridium guangxiense]MCD2348367.1 leucine-rich repeat domain-containing protein [Clostridium guangxiense]
MKKYKIVFMVLFFSMFIGFNAKAEIFKDNQTVDKNKKWTITFTKPVELNDNTKNSIIVFDQNDGSNADINLELTNNNKSIVVDAPDGGYRSGEKYCLTITEDMKSQSNDTIKNPLTLTFSVAGDASGIIFNDKNLENAVRKQIGKETGDLTQNDLDKVTTLAAVNADIKDLNGIENLRNLTEVFLGGNAITSIEPLGKLTKLETINLVGCQIQDISPLSSIPSLQFLFLSGNNIVDITPIEKLTNIQYLSLDSNKIEDVSPLLKLKSLTDLEISDNPIKDTTPLKTLSSQLKRKDFDIDSSGNVIF